MRRAVSNISDIASLNPFSKGQPMETTNDIKTVMVTGATGCVAGWIVKRLLEEGLAVHAPALFLFQDPGRKRGLDDQ